MRVPQGPCAGSRAVTHMPSRPCKILVPSTPNTDHVMNEANAITLPQRLAPPEYPAFLEIISLRFWCFCCNLFMVIPSKY